MGARARPQGGWTGVIALGVLTITSYGSWFYAFGVLIDPITEDTGWTTTALGITYGAAQVLTGFGAFVGGRLLEFAAAFPSKRRVLSESELLDRRDCLEIGRNRRPVGIREP